MGCGAVGGVIVGGLLRARREVAIVTKNEQFTQAIHLGLGDDHDGLDQRLWRLVEQVDHQLCYHHPGSWTRTTPSR